MHYRQFPLPYLSIKIVERHYNLGQRLFEPRANLDLVKRAIQNLSVTDSVQFFSMTLTSCGILRIYYSEDRPSKKIEAQFIF